MEVKLLNNTDIAILDIAVGKCWGTGCKNTTEEAKVRNTRVILKHKHESIAEHINYTFDIDGISRACLQELARHRISSFSVKSSRYTLKELKTATDLSRFLVKTGNWVIDEANLNALHTTKNLLLAGLSNDVVKYSLPEAYKTSLVWTINMRSLRNFIALRTDKSALWEIQDLAMNIYSEIPQEHKYLYQDVVKKVNPEMRAWFFDSTGYMAEDSEVLEAWMNEQE